MLLDVTSPGYPPYMDMDDSLFRGSIWEQPIARLGDRLPGHRRPQGGWQYLVEDGHHRVSVIRALGMEFMDAKFGEYALPEKHTEKCRPACETGNSTAKVHVKG